MDNIKNTKNLRDFFIEPESKINKKDFQPASYIRKEFDITKDIKKVELDITACGLYKCYLNGNSVTDQIFMPGFTFYEKRLQYQTYNVTDSIKKGKNVISVILGDGWYRGKIGVFSKRNFYGEKTKLALILNLEYTDGSTENIKTDQTWKATKDGPIRKSDLKDGEIYDARMELNGWLEPNYDDNNWNNVYSSEYNGILVKSEGEPILEHERFKPEVLITPDGSTVLDFKQNLLGYVEFTVSGQKGHNIKLIHGEVLDENDNFTMKNLSSEGFVFKGMKLLQEIEYTLKQGKQTYKPFFTVHGFRYVKVENWPETVVPENFTSIAIYSDLKPTGNFECSNELVNQLVKNTIWSQKSNFMDIPTDCPQRERAGWTGDISCYSETACYLMDVKKFLKKWIKDLTLQQREDGCVGSIVPAVGMPKFVDGAAGWADAAVIIPYVIYNAYGDIKVLQEQYDSMINWMKFLENRSKKTHCSRWLKKNPFKEYTIDSGFHWGEWLEPGHIMGVDAIIGYFHPDFEVATAYYANSCRMMAEISKILGKSENEKKFSDLFEKIREGYHYNYTKNGVINSKRQCKYVRPISLDLLSTDEKLVAIKKLNELVVENQYKIGTGFLTTPKILQILCEYGFIDTAYKMLENTERPGWLYEVKKGATTIWENWNGIDDNGVPKDSFNHYLMGSVVGWLFSHAAGISALSPGYEKIQIKPYPGGTFTYVKCSFESVKGTILSSWNKEGEKFLLKIKVPTETQVIMPDGSIHNVNKGEYEFSSKI